MTTNDSEKKIALDTPFWGAWSIRVRLILLVLLAVLPALGIILHTGFADKKNAVANAKKNILQSVENLASLQENITASTKQLLMNIAQFPEIQNGNAQACNTLFKALLRHSLYNDNIEAIRKDGSIFASGTGEAGANVLANDYFRKALSTKDFVVGGYTIARTNNVPWLPFAFPIIDDQGQGKGVIIASLRLDRYDALLQQMEFPEKSIIGIEDRNGIRLCRFPKREDITSEKLGEHLPGKVWQRISGSQQKGTYTEVGEDGIRRIYGFVQLRMQNENKPYLYIRVGIPEKSALSPAKNRLLHELLLFGVASGLALAAAYFLGNLTIVNPIKKLVRASLRMGTGNFNLRSGIPYAKGGEIGLLAQSFDLMASALSDREIERLASEESIKKLSEQNQLILNTAAEGIVGLNSRQIVIFINPAAAAMTGYEVNDFFGRAPYDRVKTDKSGPHQCETSTCPDFSQGSKTGEGDGILWRKDGTCFPFAYSATPIIENGERLGVVLTIRDITKQKQMEEILRESEHRYREIFNNVSEGLNMLEVTSDGRFHFLEQNPAMAQSTGIPPGKIVGKFADDLSCESLGQTIITQCRCCMELGKVVEDEVELDVPAGKRFYSTTCIPLRNDEENIYRFVCIFRDITRHKKLEKELFLAKKLEIIGQLAGGVAHEVRNPLNAILSISEALFTVKELAQNPDYLPYIEHIRALVNRLSKLMTDLLDLGKPIKSDQLHSLSLKQLCNETVKYWESTETANGHPVTVVQDIGVSDPWVYADGLHLQQALLNLMDNAARCSPAESGIVFTLSPSRDGKASVKIKDSGTGIPPQKIERIFEPFFTLTKGGTGLGLTLVKHFIESIGGEVRIYNNDPLPGCTAELILNTTRREDIESETEDSADR